MGFEPFQKFMDRAAGKYGMTRQIKAAEVCESFRKIIPELFKEPDTAARFVKPAHFKDGQLTISVDSPAWAQEVIMRKEKIIRSLNQKAGKQVIKSLRTQLFS